VKRLATEPVATGGSIHDPYIATDVVDSDLRKKNYRPVTWRPGSWLATYDPHVNPRRQTLLQQICDVSCDIDIPEGGGKY
jgi:hypothetical protein